MTLPTKLTLTIPQRDLLWRVAQHKYGWTPIFRREIPVADALVRKGLVVFDCPHDRDHTEPFICATPDGTLEIDRRWPISPYALGTYVNQPEGWTPKEGVAV